MQFLSDHRADVLLLQEIPSGLRRGESFPGYEVFLPLSELGVSSSESDDPQTAILVRAGLSARSLDFAHPRMCGVVVSTRRGPVALISAYIRNTTGEGLTQLSPLVALAPLSWWGPTATGTARGGGPLRGPPTLWDAALRT